MGAIFDPTYTTLTIAMVYLEIKLYRETKNRFNITTKYEFMEDWKPFLDDWQILLNVDKVKPTLLLEILS